MTVLDGVFIGLLSAAILSLIFSLLFIFLRIVRGRQLKLLRQKRIKNKRKRKKHHRQLKQMTRACKKQLVRGIVLLFIGAAAGSGAFYSRYYQATHLGERDSEAIVQGYYLLNNLEEQVSQVSGTDNPEKLRKNIYDLSARLASFGSNSADARLSAEGGILLNRLYANMKELGLNLSNIGLEQLQNEETLTGYLADIDRTKTNQKKVFDYFSVNEAALRQKK